MRLTTTLLLFLVLSFPLNMMASSELIYGTEKIEENVVPPKAKRKKVKKYKRKRPPKSRHIELSLLQIGLYLSVAAGMTVLLFGYLGFLFIALLFIAGFFWFLSGLMITMGTILLLVNSAKNHREQNEQAGWLLLLLLFTRLGLFILIGILFGPLAAILFFITFLPSLIFYILGMSAAFRNHATKKEMGKMWKK